MQTENWYYFISVKKIVVIVAVIAVAAAGWFFRDAEPVREVVESAAGFGKSILPDNSYTVVRAENDKAAGKVDKAKGGPHALRKCVSDTRTIYTDEKCPAGSREAPISEGNVMVVPSQRPVEKSKGEEKSK